MKYHYRLGFIILFFITPLLVVRAEEIQQFDASIDIHEDATFHVVETIEYDFGEAERHGIFRYILTDHPQGASAWYKTRYLDITDLSAQVDGQTVPFTTDRSGSEVSIKIGDPDQTITGVHTYTISYDVAGGLSYLEDGNAELYWNVTGDGWEVPIKGASATVTGPEDALTAQSFCYSGTRGSTGYCKEIVATSSTVTFASEVLQPGENLTIAQGLDGGRIETLILERTPTWWIWLLAIFAWFAGVIRFVYRYRTAHKPDVPIVAQYEPYQDFKPMFSGVLIDGRLQPQDIAAGLIYLAEQGFLTITKTSRKVLLVFETDDYDLTLRRPIDEVETNFLQSVLGLLFDSDSTVGATVALSKIKTDTTKQRANYKAMQALRTAIKNDLVERGFFERLTNVRSLIIGLIVLVIVLAFGIPFLATLLGPVVIVIVLVLIVSTIILGFIYQRRTRKGYEAMNHLKGFKEFLSVTDKERFSFHNAPKKSPEQFMEYLPYAIAFGVEKEWAAVFKDIALPNPDWYQGNTGTTFTAVALTNDLGAFSSSFASSSGTAPASSGGGFSGGGGGGGGGGSW